MSFSPSKILRSIARYYLDLAEAYAKINELEKAQEYIERAFEVLDKKDCPCLEAKSKNLLQIIKELKRVI